MFSKIIHFHLPKNAGTSINAWLSLLAPASSVCPASFAANLVKQKARFSDVEFWPGDNALESGSRSIFNAEVGKLSRGYWNIIHGHSYGIVTVDPSFYRFAILRDPTERFLSFIRDWRRLGRDDIQHINGNLRSMWIDASRLNADEFIQVHANKNYFKALSQTSFLRGAAVHALPEASKQLAANNSDLACAKLALERLFNYVGIYANLHESIRCISRDIGAPPPEVLTCANAGLKKSDRDLISPSSLGLLGEVWKDDYQLYAHVNSIDIGFNAADYSEKVFEQSGNLEIRLSTLRPRYMGWGLGFTFNDQLVGSGFHERQAALSAEVHAWTGPGIRSVIYIPVPQGERIDLFLDIVGYASNEVRASVRVTVDGIAVNILRKPAETILERIWACVDTSRPFVKVELIVDRTLSPADLGLNFLDKRKVGLAIRGYGFRVSAEDCLSDKCWPTEAVEKASLPARFGQLTQHDMNWAADISSESIAIDKPIEQILEFVTIGIDPEALSSTVTYASLKEAFERVLCRTPPPEWIDFWVGSDSLTLYQLYSDLIAGDEFTQLRKRFSWLKSS